MGKGCNSKETFIAFAGAVCVACNYSKQVKYIYVVHSVSKPWRPGRSHLAVVLHPVQL